MKQNIFIVASGTGGHVIPAKNIASLLIDSNYTVTWIGTKHGIENKIVNVRNRYNRLLAYPAHFAHAPTDLFGEDFYTGRMTLTFFMSKDWTWD